MYVKPDLTSLAKQKFLVKSSSSWEEAAKEPEGTAHGGAGVLEIRELTQMSECELRLLVLKSLDMN